WARSTSPACGEPMRGGRLAEASGSATQADERRERATRSQTAQPADSERRIVTTPSDRAIVMTRVFNAPRRLVFEAWTKPELLARWFGPRGWTVPVCEIDLRPGGAYRYVLRGPDGAEMGMRGVYREIVPPERLVCTEVFDQWPDSESVITALLTEQDGKTTWTATVVYP